jgi:hypothetical protein
MPPSRGGGDLPKLRRFEAGDFVYLRVHNPHSTLEIFPALLPVHPAILQVKTVRLSGVLVLEGKCGGTITPHADHCAPCHLPHLDPTQDLSLLLPGGPGLHQMQLSSS